MRLNIILLLTAILLFNSSCQDDVNDPIGGSGKAPGPVTNTKVTALAGSALVTYTLPNDANLLYVKAKYKTKSGKTMEARSSYYTNRILLEGFDKEGEYEVALSTVNRTENESSAVIVKVNVLIPPVHSVAQGLEIKEDFGGISVKFENSSKADLSMFILTRDVNEVLSVINAYYTSSETGRFNVRGFESEPREFGVYLRDKWNNYSDTIFVTRTPVYEKKLDKKLFKAMELPGDSKVNLWDGSMEYIWDDRIVGEWDGKTGLHTGNAPSKLPKFFTFDMGVKAQLSRFTLHTLMSDKHFYGDVSPRLYELWGTDNPDPSGSFDGWTRLALIENIKPSGLPVGVLTEDDRAAGRRGDEVDIPSTMPKIRYIRIRCLNNWSGNVNMVIGEVTFWGDDK